MSYDTRIDLFDVQIKTDDRALIELAIAGRVEGTEAFRYMLQCLSIEHYGNYYHELVWAGGSIGSWRHHEEFVAWLAPHCESGFVSFWGQEGNGDAWAYEFDGKGGVSSCSARRAAAMKGVATRRVRERERAWEEEAEREYGPPAERRAKNQRFVAELVSRHTEPVVRGLLVALSRLKSPGCAQDLSEFDLLTADLSEVIQLFELCGRHFEITAVDGDEFTVEISRGHGNAGGGGRFVFERCGGDFRLARELEQWTY